MSPAIRPIRLIRLLPVLGSLIAAAAPAQAPAPDAGRAQVSTRERGAMPDFDYHLQPRRVADGVYMIEGRREDFSTENGGNIVNTGFIVGNSGVIVIDTGPSRRYGEQLRAAIARITPLPVVLTLNTHHHPDHFLGNQAFPPATLAALTETITGIETEGGAFNDNMYRLNGDWMRDTEVVVPQQRIAPGRRMVGGRDIELLALGGHTAADLVLIDHATGTLFASDLVFNHRAPTTPHADLARWIAALASLAELPVRHYVPGHGPASDDASPLLETRAYLEWLGHAIHEAAAGGMDMAEVLARPVPSRFTALALADREYRRSVSHLFPAAERAALVPSTPR
ncbi:MAG: quinoprotein relay system zinc metallohydrolase 1 [Proteobacteria bacterium]|nr:quinoprotein relay system zinc metallohydrolase 1 [Pseudomonadota bacterium]